MAGQYFYGFHVWGTPASKILQFCKDNKASVPRATWTDESKLHVTLRFVGDKCPDAPTGMDTLARLGVKLPPIKLHVKGMGTFNNRSGPRVLFATVSPLEELKQLNKEFGGNPATFTPHLTVAKLEDTGDAEPEFATLAQHNCTVDFGTCVIDELKLYQTQGGGKPYKVVAFHRLIGNAL